MSEIVSTRFKNEARRVVRKLAEKVLLEPRPDLNNEPDVFQDIYVVNSLFRAHNSTAEPFAMLDAKNVPIKVKLGRYIHAWVVHVRGDLYLFSRSQVVTDKFWETDKKKPLSSLTLVKADGVDTYEFLAVGLQVSYDFWSYSEKIFFEAQNKYNKALETTRRFMDVHFREVDGTDDGGAT